METKESITSETIADIVREMREDDGLRMEFPGMVKAVPNIWILKWCDRIEAAAKRDEREADCTNCDYANVVAENERLRAAIDEICKTKDEMIRQRCEQINRLNAALAPVMGIHIEDRGGGSYIVPCNIVNAVREAQRIAREGEAK